jgi:hypothetical protein
MIDTWTGPRLGMGVGVGCGVGEGVGAADGLADAASLAATDAGADAPVLAPTDALGAADGLTGATDGDGDASAVADADAEAAAPLPRGRGVELTVAAVSRSGGGLRKSSTCATTRLNAQPARRVSVAIIAAPTTSVIAASVRSVVRRDGRRDRGGGAIQAGMGGLERLGTDTGRAATSDRRGREGTTNRQAALRCYPRKVGLFARNFLEFIVTALALLVLQALR